MKPTDCERIKQQLLRMYHDLDRRREILAGAIQQHESPPGEHERRVVPSLSIESDLRAERAEDQIAAQITEALDRIADGTYGTCRACGQAIPRQRLEALPYATCCVDCEAWSEAF